MSFSSNSLGRRSFIAGTAGVAASVVVAGAVQAAAVPTGATKFVALPPRRLCDTRPSGNGETRDFGYSFVPGSANTIRVKVAGNGDIPADATAAVFTIAGIAKSKVKNWVQAVPAGTGTTVSNVNMEAFDNVVANLVTVKLGVDGAVDIRSLEACNIILDIAGVYVPTSSKSRSGRLVAIDPPLRTYDTRLATSNGGQPVSDGQTVKVDFSFLPSNATAVVANVTAVRTGSSGYVTVFPSDQSGVPTSSNLNFGPGQNRAVSIITKLGTTDGRMGINLFVRGGCHLLVDVAGYFTGEGAEESEDGLFVPIAPSRMLDTRRAADKAVAGGKARLWPGWTRPFVPAVDARAGALSMNVTAINGMEKGFVTVLAAQTVRRVVSNLNVAYRGQTVANHTITKISSQGVECFSDQGCHIACDVTGWFVGTKAAATQGAPLDPAPPPAQLPWTVEVKDMSLYNGVYEGLPDPIVDSGNSWHWSGTGKVGQTAAVVAFGHRTSKSGPYRNQHLLGNDDVLTVVSSDQRLFTFRWRREVITSSDSTEILNASRAIAGVPTFTLVSCTGSRYVRDDQPRGGITYRLVSTFVLESWTDIG